jgi:putative ABC transport system permease protein
MIQLLIQLFICLVIVLTCLFVASFVTILSTVKGRRSFLLALRSLRLHKMRAFLSVLGIVIGTAAVIALMAFGEGSMQEALADIERLGATNIMVQGVKPPESTSTTQQRVAVYGLTYEDYDLLGTIDAVTRRVPMRIFNHKARYLDREHDARLVATLAAYAEINQLDLARGRFLLPEDNENMNNVAVLASGTAEKLFPFEDAVGQSVRIDKYLYRVVGVLNWRMPTGGSGGSQAAENFNNDVYIPLKTCRVRFGDTIIMRRAGSFQREQVALHQVTLTVSDRDKVRPVGKMVSDLLEERHLQKDWQVTVPLDLLEKAQRDKDRYLGLLAMIACISLFVGGIGIMNIMLATVTERTREIGVRRALGAKRRDITLQFLIEAMVQTTAGGLLGVVVGIGLSYLFPLVAKLFGGHLPAQLNQFSFLISLSVTFAVGIGFGVYPALKASRLDPIEALRHE